MECFYNIPLEHTPDPLAQQFMKEFFSFGAESGKPKGYAADVCLQGGWTSENHRFAAWDTAGFTLHYDRLLGFPKEKTGRERCEEKHQSFLGSKREDSKDSVSFKGL